jgi:putative ABC transport system permease protein
MNAWRFILSSLRHYRRIHWAVALGVAVATAVLTGALLVGDSVRGSLRDLTLQRLGRIDSVIVAPHMFRAELAGEVAGNSRFEKHFASAQPAILLNGTLQSGSRADTRRATSVSVIGCEPQFWSMGEGGPMVQLPADDAAITESLAKELNVSVGESILLQIPVAGAIPADSPLGAKQLEKTSRSRRFRVGAILPPVSLARFGLMPSQQLPRNVFVSLAALQKLVEQPDKANAILVATDRPDVAAGSDAQAVLRGILRPQLEDYGIRVEWLDLPANRLQVSGDQLVLPSEVIRAAAQPSKGRLQPVVTYLANTIAVRDRKIPYSTITGVQSAAKVGPLIDDSGNPIELADNEIVLNRWAADNLKAKVGDDVTVTFYKPESTHGKLEEHQPPPVFKLKAIAELKDKAGKPTAAADPRLTPEMPGVTDQKSISDWDLPFELVEKIRPEDEKYWDEYRTTPKAFVSLATAEKLWANRWGAISLLRLPADRSLGESKSDFGQTLRYAIDPAKMGVSLLPVKQMGLAASAGTTPFGGLFLGFSFFLIAAAVMLVALLFQLGIQQRASELGTLAAIGVGRRRISRLLSREGMVVAAAGATFGVVAGVLYAWLVIYALTTWWVAAISTPFLRLHVEWPSLVIGWFVGVVVSWLAIRWSIRKLVRLPAARLLSGSTENLATHAPAAGRRWWLRWPTIRIVLVVLTVAMCAAGFFMHGEEQAGIFFTSGAAMLALLLGELRCRLRSHRGLPHQLFSLMRLSALNTARNPGRSTLTIGLVAAASFLIVAVSAFQLNTGEAGTGGFEFLATSDQPIHYDLNTPDGRRELGFSDIASRQMDHWRVFSLRLAAGEDASCLNLYQPKQPRVLGVPAALIERGGFGWSATSAGYSDKPWMALDTDLGPDADGNPIVPAALDMSTAVYSLHLGGVGSQISIHDAAGRPVTVQVVGLLENSVLQGNLLVSEGNFLKLFPDTGGYRFFLLEHAVGPPSRGGPDEVSRAEKVPLGSRHLQSEDTQSVSATLESSLAEEGFDVVDAREQLAQFLAVQNTYLSTFQSLGALGLLLGTIGLAVVQLRSVLERRGELALMRAGGFARARLTWMVIWENAVLLVGGLAVGCFAAVVALIPQWMPHGASVPWGTLALLLGAIALVGMLAGWLATRSTLRAPIVGALRGD